MSNDSVKQEVILMVEDEPDIANLINILLQGCGYRVLWDNTGKRVFEILQDEQNVDLILLDLKLGEMDGLDISSELRQSRRWKDIPIIMVTCRNRQEDKINGLTAGADDYITKPFNNEELVLRVRTRLRMRVLENSLRISEEKFRRLSENAQDIIYRINANQEFDYLNPAIERISGYSQEELMDRGLKGFLGLIYNDDRKELSEGLKGLWKGKGEREIEYRLLTKDKGVVWLHDKRIPVYNDKNELIAIEGIIRDITDLKRMEERKIEIEKLKALRFLAGGAAHNINQPLSCIKTFLQVFEKKIVEKSGKSDTEKEILADVKLVEEAVDRICEIVKQLSSIVTIETATYPSGGEILDLKKSSMQEQIRAKSKPD